MSAGLPSMIYGDGISKKTQVRFGGYNHNLGAADGEIWDMENLTSDYYPLLAPREKRKTVLQMQDVEGMFFADSGVEDERYLYIISKNILYRANDGLKEMGKLIKDGGERVCVTIGRYVIILPDKVAWNTETDKIEALESSWEGTASLHDGKYMGEKAEANTIYAEDVTWNKYFKVGDAVTIEGWSVTANNKTIIIREIEGNYLRFYENSFTMPEDGRGEGGISIKRKMPDMDFICENENRLWGCKGNTIYASKLGDPFNWNVFDGVATDSFAVDVGSAGDFTGCISYMGYPCFFKEDHIYKVYGDRPANFQVMGSASLGVAKGSWRSLAVAGETLFYLSRVGIVAYTGGIPQSVADAFGDVKYKNAVAGSDGIKYYIYMREKDGGKSCCFVYDTRKNMWHKEKVIYRIVMYAFDEGTLVWAEETGSYAMALPQLVTGTENEIKQYGNRTYTGVTTEEEEDIDSFAEFGDFTENDPNRKGVSKLQLRVELSEGAAFKVEIQFDSDGVWHKVKELKTDRKKSFYLPIIPRRCDHYRIKLSGSGDWKLHSMVRETYSGSEL